MSLINQMLKELDARRSEVTGTDSYGQQIRAVPDRTGVHPAWWVAGALGVVSSGLLAWVLLRPPVAPQGVTTTLPLKSDASLNTSPSTMEPASVPDKSMSAADAPAVATVASVSQKTAAPPISSESGKSSLTGVPVATIAASTEPVRQPPTTAATTEPSSPQNQQKPAQKEQTPSMATVKPAETKRPEPARNAMDKADASFAAESVKPVKPIAAGRPANSPAAADSEMLQPSAAVKQVKEFTPQQRVENEYRKALGALQQGKAAEAIAGLEQAVQLDPHHAGARQALIGTLIESRRTDDALRMAREGLSADPAQPNLSMILARLQVEKGEQRSAIETLERGLPHAGDRADYQAFLAALLQRDGQHKRAADYYLQALQKSSQNGVWWMGLGISLQADQKLPEAQEAFRRAKASNGLTPELLAFIDARLNQLQR